MDGQSLSGFKVKNEGAPVIYAAFHYGSNLCHWMQDILPGLIYLKRERPDLLNRPVSVTRTAIATEHVRYWADLLGLTLCIHPQNDESNQVVVNWPKQYTCDAYPLALQWIKEFVPNKESTNKRRLLVKRNQENGRQILNEDEIAKLFNMEIIVPGRMTIPAQMQAFYEAELVIGVHGAALANITYCRPGTTVVEFRTPVLWSVHYEEISRNSGLNYHLVDAEMADPKDTSRGAHINIDPKSLCQYL